MVDKRPAGRFFCVDLPESGPVSLSVQEAHHALHVLRVKPGASVELFDGRGTVATGHVASIGRRNVVVTVSSRCDQASRAAVCAHLAFAVPKGKRLDWLIEKASELEVDSLWPIVFERSVAGRESLSDARLERWRGHCISAAKQCGSNFLPEIAQPTDVTGLIERAAGCLKILGDARGCDPVMTVLSTREQDQAVCLVVGPEGGLTDAERDQLLAAACVPARIGTSTLRVETAAVVLLGSVRAGESSLDLDDSVT